MTHISHTKFHTLIEIHRFIPSTPLGRLHLGAVIAEHRFWISSERSRSLFRLDLGQNEQLSQIPRRILNLSPVGGMVGPMVPVNGTVEPSATIGDGDTLAVAVEIDPSGLFFWFGPDLSEIFS